MATSKLDEWITEDNLIRIKHWFRDGLTDEEVATKKMGISRSTFYNWLKESKELKEAVKAGKMPIDDMVEDSVAKHAIGFFVIEEKIDPNGDKTQYRKFIKGDVAAMALWLKNRRHNKWKDKWDIEINKDLPPVVIDDVRE